MEIRTSEQIDKVSAAMLAAQSKIKNAELDSSNPHFRSKYASLTAVLDACKKPLNESGILFMQAPAGGQDKETLCLVTRFIHAESGQWIEASFFMPLQKIDPQGMGSAITYARRYSLMAMLGMAAEDDDAEAAMNRSAPPGQQPAPQRPAPRNPAPAQGMSEDGLPSLRDVTFEAVNIDGQQYWSAKGNVYPQKEALKSAGFRWDGNRKLWLKQARPSLQDYSYEEPPVSAYDEVPF